MIMTLSFGGRKHYTDSEVVDGLQQRDRRTEDWFYGAAKRYFDAHFNDVFFDKDRKQEIFQTAFLKLWTEIENGKITNRDGAVCRQQRDGAYAPMTCQLTTFLMTFAKNEFREMVRSNRLDRASDNFDTLETAAAMVTTFDTDEEVEAQKNRIVDDCLQQISPRCVEVLTLFYYEGKSLDEILLLRGDRNSSKNGLKTAKNKCMTALRNMVLEEYRREALVS